MAEKKALLVQLPFEPKAAQAEKPAATIHAFPNAPDADEHFIQRDGVTFAGQHLIIDLWGCSRLDDLPHVRETLIECVRAIKATLLNIDLHHFTPNGGISGVAVLAESHLSIHSWPEKGYAALDVFVCGESEPHRAVPVLKKAFSPTSVQLTEMKRGLVG